MIDRFMDIIGTAHVLTGKAAAKYARDWTGKYNWSPLGVLRPANTGEVAACLSLANEMRLSVVPVSGNTGLAGGTQADGAVMLSLERLNHIREVNAQARSATVEAGVILETLQTAVEAEGLIFPLTFGAKGSAMIGGCLATNAGGSNVLRYGNTRDLCLGIEAVLPTGEVVDLMTPLHKDNSGFDLRHLLIGAEGTLGIITAAVLKLAPKPRAYATAMVAAKSLEAALTLLNRLQEETGGAVEAFEYMPDAYLQEQERHSGQPPVFAARHAVNLLIELGDTAPDAAQPDAQGRVAIAQHLESALEGAFERGDILDAVIAQTEAQRRDMWARREAAAEVCTTRFAIINDIALPLDKVASFFDQMEPRLPQVDAGAQSISVAHLGDGNIHYTVWPAATDPAVHDAIIEAVEDVVLALGGSFSAEHGVGTAKLTSMQRRKDAGALMAMRRIKAALDPLGILNPGKVLP